MMEKAVPPIVVSTGNASIRATIRCAVMTVIPALSNYAVPPMAIRSAAVTVRQWPITPFVLMEMPATALNAARTVCVLQERL
jgi:hypothetical protein